MPGMRMINLAGGGMKPETELLHRGDSPCDWEGALNPPVVHASLFCFESLHEYLDATAGKLEHYSYGRSGNPTRRVLEEKIAFLEKAEDALALSSGMAAITSTLMALLKAGDHLLVVSCVYGPVRALCDHTLRSFGVETDYFRPEEAADLSERIRPNTRLVYLESPGSLTFDIQDLRAAARCAREHGLISIIDNTWATPLYQTPLELGIDLSIHSGTKYIAGHSDMLLGLVAGSDELMRRIRAMANALGGALAPDDAYLAIRGLRTLPVRMARHQDSGLRVARWLQARPEVCAVLHPGLPSFAGYALAQTQMRGYSSLFGFRLQPRGEQARHRFVDTLLQLFRLGYSWGGYESLILPLLNHQKGNAQLREQLGLDDDTYRICIGLEHPDDLIAVLDQALAAWAAA
jgi:cystathionine beta-lyase